MVWTAFVVQLFHCITSYLRIFSKMATAIAKEKNADYKKMNLSYGTYYTYNIMLKIT